MDRKFTDIVCEMYDLQMFGRPEVNIDKIGFYNVGYWKGVEHSLEVAQINLIETLIDFFTKRDGNVLDVACGKGASSKFLTKYFDPKKITGINISEKQLEICKVIASECNFLLMDAVDLSFENSTYDNILCMEAALHFKTRNKFFREANRVLNPGGRLAMSDVLCDHSVNAAPILMESCPRENSVASLEEYEQSLYDAGFSYVRIEDITQHSLAAFDAHEARRREQSESDGKSIENYRRGTAMSRAFFSKYCLVYAIK